MVMPVGAVTPQILLVEDDEADRTIFLRAAERSGMRAKIQVASDGEEALAHLHGTNGILKLDRRACVVLLDLNMPGMSGFELLARIRGARETKTLPVIVLTTSDNMEDVMKCYELGANSFITKPAQLDELIDVLSEIDRYWFSLVTLPSLPA
ncbi:MAG TPA: response regulator [Parvularculaceae bacterium]|nr:response regulator [Parvularculaceae bacterium]